MHNDTLPPFRLVSSQLVSTTDASSILDKYIANSTRHAHLHPDALITPSGVTFSTQGGASGGVVMHNLRRVAAGLRGEFMEPDPTPEPEEQESAPQKKKAKGKLEEVQQDWQDMSEYEREEGLIEVGEVGDRTNVVQEGGEVPEVQVVDEENQDNGKQDKAARKKAKKQREKELRKQKEEARAKKST